MRPLVLLALAACAPTIESTMSGPIAAVRDPVAAADLRAIGSAPADAPAGTLARCILAVAGDSGPPPDFAHDYTPYQGCLVPDVEHVVFQHTCAIETSHSVDWTPCEGDPTDDCLLARHDHGALSRSIYAAPCGEPCGSALDRADLPPALAAMADRYVARCAAETDQTLAAMLGTEIDADLASARAARDANQAWFGATLAQIGDETAAVAELHGAPAIIAKAQRGVAALRTGVYGTRAMSSLIELEPAVVKARAELAAVEPELGALRGAVKSPAASDADRARLAALEPREQAAQATIAAARTELGYDGVLAREQAAAHDPALKPARDRIEVIARQLDAFRWYNRSTSCRDGQPATPDDWVTQCCRPGAPPTADELKRIGELLSERRDVEAALAAIRDRHGVHWPL